MSSRNYSSSLNRIKWKAVHISAIWCYWYYVQEFQIKSKLKIHLTHFQPMFHFCTPWKHQKTSAFLMFSRGYRSGTLAENGLIKEVSVKNLLVSNLIHLCLIRTLKTLRKKTNTRLNALARVDQYMGLAKNICPIQLLTANMNDS